MAEGHHGGLLADPHVWVLFSAIIFAVIALVKGRAPVLSLLDKRTARIKADLEEAARLRAEAEALLSDYQAKHKDAVQTAQKIIDSANEAAALLRQESERKLDADLKQRETVLAERIKRAEMAAVQSLRQQAADIAAKAAENLLAEHAPKRNAKLVDETIEGLNRIN